MAIQQGVWGIDLGQCALKALRLEMIEGQLTATAFDYVEHPKILSQPDADPDQLTREALEKFLERNTIKGDLVAISVPGQSGLARFVKLPPVEEKKIPDIVRFEAKQQIPFNLDEVVWDYQKIGTGAVTDGFAMETEIGLFAIKRDTVNRYLQHFNDVGVEVHLVQMAPLSLCNFVSFDLLGKGGDAPTTEEEEEEDDETAGKKKCVVALDIGADNSNLVVTDGERIIWQRPIPLGGNHFTRALTKDLKLTFAKAEHLKRNATKSPDLKKILLALRPVLNDFVGEVQRSLSFFTGQQKNAHVKYMIGLGNAFRLPGLQKFLSEKLQLEVRKLSHMNRLGGDSVVTAPAYAENVLSYAVAYGLALQGLKLPRLQTNLLPHEIRFDRLIRAKKPWAVAAAAVLLFGTSFWALGSGLQYQAVAGSKVDSAIKEAEQVKQDYDSRERKFSEKNTEIENSIKGVKSILAGSSERYNWLEFMKFLSEALPRPDGSNLLDEKTEESYWPGGTKDRRGKSIRDHYWNDEAEHAYKKFLAQQTGVGAKDKDDDEGLEHLIQANIVSVMPMYTDNLENFFVRLKAEREAGTFLQTMHKKDRESSPNGKGWVVELRGYTYHHDGRRFVEWAVVRNLATYRPDVMASPQPATPGKDGAGTTPTPMPGGGGGQPAPTNGQPTSGGAAPEGGHPVWGRVSHVVRYRAVQDDTPEGRQFKEIGGDITQDLSRFLGTAAPGGGGVASEFSGRPPATVASPEGDLGGTSAASPRGPWRPLGGYTLPGSRTSDPGLQRGGGGTEVSGGVSSERGPLDIGTGSPTTTSEKPGPRKKLTRTEFIILFVWQEPTPSDQLLGEDTRGTPATDTGAPP